MADDPTPRVICPRCLLVRRVGGAKDGSVALCRSCSKRPFDRKSISHSKARQLIDASRKCPVCENIYAGRADKTACSIACVRRLHTNDPTGYFGGRLQEALGLRARICQICEKRVKSGGQVHHALGHPDHSYLVFLCAGCHDLVTQLGRRTHWTDETFARLISYAKIRLHRDPSWKAEVKTSRSQ